MGYKILAINPGSTSTKISVSDDDKFILVEDIVHTQEELKHFKKISDQFDYRKEVILAELKKRGIPLQFDAIVGRGGLAKPVESGVYKVTDEMVAAQLTAFHQHACDLGCAIANEIGKALNCPNCFIADPGVVDEMYPEAHISGTPLIQRVCIWHALNQKAIARRFAKDMGKKYEDLNLIICHLGGGISIAAHEKGKAVDANNALNGEGPFSPERTGSLPVADLIHLCYTGKFTEQELITYISNKAGLTAHLGTNNCIEIEKRIEEGDKHAELILNAMAFHVAKSIAAEGAVLCGKIDAVIFTGGIARSNYLMDIFKKRLSYLAPIYIYPGQDEMLALTENALAVLKGEREAKDY